MTDFSSIDPQSMATQLAGFDVQALQTQLKTQQGTLTAQKNALRALKTTLSDFRTALQGLNKTNAGMLKTSASVSVENRVSVTTTSEARKGTYNLFVEQLASSHQVAFDSLTDDAVSQASGSMSITINGKSIDVDMDSVDSLAGLAKAINGAQDNPGVTASLVRTGGQVRMMLSSDKSGAENAIQLGGSVPAAMSDSASVRTISRAQDAVVWLGEKGNGLQVTSSTNTFSNLIDGVTLELNQAQGAAETPLRIDIGVDTKQTEEQMKTFVDAYNKLLGALGTLTASGSGSTERGALAGDASISNLRRDMNQMLRSVSEGLDITQFGLSADKDGKLKLDNDKLADMLAEDPGKLNGFFNGSNGLLRKMDKSLDKYLSVTDGVIKNREETFRRRENELTDRSDKITTRYDNAYNRYLSQFTRLQSVMQQMNSTANMFGLV